MHHKDEVKDRQGVGAVFPPALSMMAVVTVAVVYDEFPNFTFCLQFEMIVEDYTGARERSDRPHADFYNGMELGKTDGVDHEGVLLVARVVQGGEVDDSAEPQTTRISDGRVASLSFKVEMPLNVVAVAVVRFLLTDPPGGLILGAPSRETTKMVELSDDSHPPLAARVAHDHQRLDGREGEEEVDNVRVGEMVDNKHGDTRECNGQMCKVEVFDGHPSYSERRGAASTCPLGTIEY